MFIEIKATKAQVVWYDWALTGMADSYADVADKMHNEDITADDAQAQIAYYDKLAAGFAQYGIAEEKIKAATIYIELPINPAVISDVLYYLEESAPAVAETDAESDQQAEARARSALNMATKIREQVPGAQSLTTTSRE